MSRCRQCVAIVVAVVVTAASGRAESPEHDARALSRHLMSPYCPGLLLADCRSEGARLLRVEIEQRLAAGDTAGAVEADLVRRFGPSIRTVPDFRGFGLIAWIVPPVVGMVGLAGAVLAIRIFTRRHPADPSGGVAAESAEDIVMSDRVRDELEELD